MKKQDSKVAFLTLGCKVNAYETDAMENLFLEEGYEIVDFHENADIYVVNTCSVTNIADRKSRQMLHQAKKRNPNGVIVAVGCYVQTAREQLQLDDMIDVVIGNNQKHKIVEVVTTYQCNHKKQDKTIAERVTEQAVIDINAETGYESLMIDSAGEKTRAYIKIQDGCNQFCSYCIIPYARGRVRSRKAEDIVEEVSRLAGKGYQEFVLTGIHLSSYGVDLMPWKEKAPFMNFVELKGEPLLKIIDLLSQLDGVNRIRLGSLEPRIITEEFVSKLLGYKKVCPHFHLSLQSGCNETLKRMNRKYTSEEYLEKCYILRKIYDKPAITTDVIVGFPGETEDEFSISKEFLEKAAFAQMHIFKYSKRKGTKAESMSDQVEDSIKSYRSDVLLSLEEKMEREYQNTFIGTEQLVLIEETMEWQGEKYQVGHNERYMKLAFRKELQKEETSNQIKKVKILSELKKNVLLCEPIYEE